MFCISLLYLQLSWNNNCSTSWQSL